MGFEGSSPGTSARSLTIIDTSVRGQCNCHMVTSGRSFKSRLAQLWVGVTFEGDFIAACLYCKFKSAKLLALNNRSQKFNKFFVKNPSIQNTFPLHFLQTCISRLRSSSNCSGFSTIVGGGKIKLLQEIRSWYEWNYATISCVTNICFVANSKSFYSVLVLCTEVQLF